MNGTFYTVNAEHLAQQADSIERDADQSLKAWILIGQGDRYGEEMKKVRALRAAASERSVSIRREILRNAGFSVLTPRDALRGAV